MGQRLGQHFLIREGILRRIAAAACGDSRPAVIEIGPGRGALTAHLLQLASRVIANEIDEDLAARLRARFAGEPRLEVVTANVLEADLSRWGQAVVAGNLPYYITSPIVERTLRLGPLLERAVFLVQKEVAERLAALPGSRDYGYLSVLAQLCARVETLFGVPPAAFRPPPKVESAVVRLTPHGAPLSADPEGFLRFAARCFRQKRKTLRNNLLEAYGREAVGSQPEAAMRAEQLSVAQLVDLYRRLRICPTE